MEPIYHGWTEDEKAAEARDERRFNEMPDELKVGICKDLIAFLSTQDTDKARVSQAKYEARLAKLEALTAPTGEPRHVEEG